MINVSALLQVLLVSLVAGTGTVVVFSLGLLGLSAFQTRNGDAGTSRRAGVAGLVFAIGCFLVVATGIALGIHALLAA